MHRNALTAGQEPIDDAGVSRAGRFGIPAVLRTLGRPLEDRRRQAARFVDGADRAIRSDTAALSSESVTDDEMMTGGMRAN